VPIARWRRPLHTFTPATAARLHHSSNSVSDPKQAASRQRRRLQRGRRRAGSPSQRRIIHGQFMTVNVRIVPQALSGLLLF
jgi:hypothetical protein